jgi:tRNA U34 2-thiouridine synthase MnmA/TrmU
MKKILLLFSGGLDSLLAAVILKEQGLKIIPVCFCSYFFNCKKSLNFIKQLKLKLKVIDISKDHLKIVKKPKHGIGVGVNPCIDCHLLMLKKAKQIMKKEGCDFIATGEVLGQRPFSQSRQSLELIEKRAGLRGLIIRPLSDKLLKETKFGNSNFYNISGKSRKKQLDLAKKFNIKEIPTPAGGCILTDNIFAVKFRKLLKRNKNISGNDIELLKIGRIFFQNNYFVIVARNYNECKELIKKRRNKDILLEPDNFSGPTVLIRKIKKSSQDEMINFGSNLIIKFSKKVNNNPVIKILPFQ